MARSYFRGHPIIFTEGEWLYRDTKTQVKLEYKERSCGKCGKISSGPNKDGPDPCLGNLPGVDNACCGHGKQSESYIIFKNGVTIRDFKIEKEAEEGR